MSEPAANLGLRERKKLATRQALSTAAMRLAIERGLDNVRVEDIAAAADISVRTFHNYFSSKEEAICAISVDRTRRIGFALRERPPNEPLWDAITEAVLEQFAGIEELDQELIAGIRLVGSELALHAEQIRARLATQRILAEAIAERTGTQVDRDLYPWLLANVVTTATDASIHHWLNAGHPVALVPLLREALEQLAAGLPAPPPTQLPPNP